MGRTRRLEDKVKNLLKTLIIAAVPMIGISQAASADVIEDPFLEINMNLTNTCPANCASLDRKSVV
jgi:hypothetical protein